ncbi:MAG: thioredoxin [Hyphomicrobiaceae bacterium]|nr:thioredoxin [Hyphomicrobiaceae bacterium]
MSVIINNNNTTKIGSDLVKDTSTSAFTKDVIEASHDRLIIVDFWASWCAPCKQLAPLLEKIVASYKEKVSLLKLNIDEHPAIAGQLRIQSLPTVYAFRDGRPIDGFMGLQSESAIREFIDRSIGPDMQSDLENTLARAEQALESSDLKNAAEIYASVLQTDPHNSHALAGLANCYLKSGDRNRAQQTIALIPPEKQNTPCVARVVATLKLTEQAAEAKDLDSLEARLKADPSDYEARLELAIVSAANGDKERAVTELLELYCRDRDWNQDAARKQLVQFFEAWGPKDPHTLDGRKRLSSLMFA